MRPSTKGRRSQGAFYLFCRAVTEGKYEQLSALGRDFCEDFVRPPLDRSPQSLRALLAILDRRNACPEAIEGARDTWALFVKGPVR